MTRAAKVMRTVLLYADAHKYDFNTRESLEKQIEAALAPLDAAEELLAALRRVREDSLLCCDGPKESCPCPICAQENAIAHYEAARGQR